MPECDSWSWHTTWADARASVIERMDPEHYLTTSYYEHWLTAAASIAVESGIIEREELESRAGGVFPVSRPSVEPLVEGSGAQRFTVGLLSERLPQRTPDRVGDGALPRARKATDTPH